MRLPAGFTLLDALVTIAVATTLAFLGLPWLGDIVLDARRSAGVNDFVHGFHFARQEAFRSRRDVVICRSSDGRRCAAAGDWGSGWILFLNRDGDEPPVIDAGEEVLRVAQRTPGLRISSNRRYYVLRPWPRRATNGTLVVCDRRGSRTARAVVVSYTGRPRVSQRTAGGNSLVCPV